MINDDGDCRIFLCYREAGAETAKAFYDALRNIKEYEYGKVWYSDYESKGNYVRDIPRLLSKAQFAVLFIHKGFTDGFIRPDGSNNFSDSGSAADCVTVREIIEIERQRQQRGLNVLCVNIDGYALSDEELHILEKVFENEGLLRNDTIQSYRNLQRNYYAKRSTNMENFIKERFHYIYESEADPEHEITGVLTEKLPEIKESFRGREDCFEKIESAFDSGARIIFLVGMGGIGKSEIAKQYAMRNRSKYSKILFTTFESSLLELVCDPTIIEISGVTKKQNESAYDFFRRKMQAFRKAASRDTLLIVDNYDVDDDENFTEFIQGNHNIIFTTRSAQHRGKSIKISSISDENVLMDIFRHYYDPDTETVSNADIPYVLDFIRDVDHHTYAIELFAKQLRASCMSARELLNKFREHRLAKDVTEHVTGRDGKNTAYGHICAIFSMDNLSENEKLILAELSLIGTRGIIIERFREWAALDSFNSVNELINKGWVQRDGNILRLHPLVCDVVRVMLNPDANSCEAFLSNMTDYIFFAWYRRAEENIKVTNNVLAIAEYFKPFDKEHMDIWVTIPSFLWQVGEFDESIRLQHIVYDTCLKEYGEASMCTGFVAKALGGCYFNSGRLSESVYWYKQGLHCMELSCETENEDYAMSLEKVARCHTWVGEFREAEELFKHALEIRLRLKEAFEKGTPPSMFEKREHYDIKLAMERIGETYMEMGRMYQLMGDYRSAIIYAKKHKRLLMKAKRDNVPGNVSAFAYCNYDIGVSHYHLGKAKREEGKERAAVKRFKAARARLSAALASNLTMRGNIALDTVDNYEYLADTYMALNESNEAYSKYTDAAAITEQLLGSECERFRSIQTKLNACGCTRNI